MTRHYVRRIDFLHIRYRGGCVAGARILGVPQAVSGRRGCPAPPRPGPGQGPATPRPLRVLPRPPPSQARPLAIVVGVPELRRIEQAGQESAAVVALTRVDELVDVRLAGARAVHDQVLELDQAGEVYPGRPGCRKLRALLNDIPEPALTRSPPEFLLLKRLRKAGVPQPRTNARVHGLEVDLLFPDHGLAVEIDGYAYHRQRPAFEDDRSRDAALAARGIMVLRFTPRQLTREPDKVLARLCLALGSRMPQR